MAIEKLGLPALQHCQSSPFTSKLGPNGLNWKFIWLLENSPQDFDFFNSHKCQTFILAEIHCYLGARIFHA